MKRIGVLRKRFAGAFTALLFVAFISCVTLFPGKAFAGTAGGSLNFTLTWSAFDTITATGDFTGDLKLSVPTVYQPDQALAGEVVYQPGQNGHKCDVELHVNADGTHLYVEYLVVASPVGSQGPTLCGHDPKLDSYGQFLTQPIQIQGTRPPFQQQNETNDQKSVYVTVYSPLPASASPPTDTITIKDASGTNTVDGPTVATQQPSVTSSMSVPADQREVIYTATFHVDGTLPPGTTYQACEVGSANTCVTFQKLKFTPINVNLGQTRDDQQIAVTIHVSFFDAVDLVRTIGPATLSIQPVDKSVAPVTTETDTATHTPTNAQLNSTSYGDIQLWLHGVFDNIKPGKYDICVVDINLCQTVTKEDAKQLKVNFDTTNVDPLTAPSPDRNLVCPQQVRDWEAGESSCPIFDAANSLIVRLEEVIMQKLTTDVDPIFGTSTAQGVQQSQTSKAYFTAWNSFRIFSVSIIILVGIIMIIAEALGLPITEAYSARRILPRLLAIGVIIALSWWGLKYAIVLANNLSAWIAGLITYPFNGIPAVNSTAWSIAGQWSFVLAASASIGAVGLMTYALTGFLALLVAAVVIIVRQFILIIIIVMSPFFLVMYLLPSTRKLGTLWTDTLIGILLMGPMFTALVASGGDLSRIAGKSGDPTGIIAFVALYLPIAFIPVAFMAIGGVMKRVLTGFSKAAEGSHGKLSTKRENLRQERLEKARTGQLYNNQLLNRAASGITNIGSGGTGISGFGIGVTKKQRANLRLKREAAAAQRLAIHAGAHAETPESSGSADFDFAQRALTYGNEAEARIGLKRDWHMDDKLINAAIARAHGKYGMAASYLAVRNLAANKGFDNVQQAAQAIARVGALNTRGGQPNLEVMRQLANEIRSVGKQTSPDVALSPDQFLGENAMGTSDSLVMREYKAMTQGTAAPSKLDYDRQVVKAISGIPSYDLLNVDSTRKENIVSSFTNVFDTQYAESKSAPDLQSKEKAEAEVAATAKRISVMKENDTWVAPVHVDIQQKLGPNEEHLNEIITRTQGQYEEQVTHTTDADGNLVENRQVVQIVAPEPHMKAAADAVRKW